MRYYDEYRLAIDWNADRFAEELFAEKDDFLQASLHIVKNGHLFENEPDRFNEKIERFRAAKAS